MAQGGIIAEYKVVWQIEIDAASPEEAARQAQAIMQDPESLATVFHVWEYSGKRGVLDLHHGLKAPVEVDLSTSEE